MNWKIKLGLALMIFSGVFFVIMLTAPFLGFQAKTKVIISTSALIAMEASFWAGGILAGKELFTKYKSHLNPKNWLKKIKPDS